MKATSALSGPACPFIYPPVAALSVRPNRLLCWFTDSDSWTRLGFLREFSQQVTGVFGVMQGVWADLTVAVQILAFDAALLPPLGFPSLWSAGELNFSHNGRATMVNLRINQYRSQRKHVRWLAGGMGSLWP